MLFRQPLSNRQLRDGAFVGVLFFSLIVLYSLFSSQGELDVGASGGLIPEKQTAESSKPAPIPSQSQSHEQPDGHPNASPPETSHESPDEIPPRLYSQALVVARIKKEDVDWIDRELVGLPDLRKVIYTVDDPQSQHRVPENKGHEVMAYLTYMIDSYDALSDVTMFMHSHLSTWHNNDLLDSSAALMIKRLSSPRVVREGYMNMRCHWDPGCPDHLHPFAGNASDNNQQPEEVIFAKSWRELFPKVTVPAVLSQPCCGQFALSKERIRSIPRDTYIYYRDWLLKSDLPDNLSGRVWEYLWQVVFAGVDEFCPKEHLCYCDGYGVCFGGEKEFKHWFDLREDKRKADDEREAVKKKEDQGKEAKLDELEQKIQKLDLEMDRLKKAALKNGMDAEFRAREVGRSWSPGDGF